MSLLYKDIELGYKHLHYLLYEITSDKYNPEYFTSLRAKINFYQKRLQELLREFYNDDDKLMVISLHYKGEYEEDKLVVNLCNDDYFIVNDINSEGFNILYTTQGSKYFIDYDKTLDEVRVNNAIMI